MAVHHGGRVGSAAKTLARKILRSLQKAEPARHWLITKPRVINITYIRIGAQNYEL